VTGYNRMIHPLACVHPAARVHPGVEIGPFCVIDEHVTVGEGCRLDAGVRLCGHTVIGTGNVFHTGCVMGDAPQDLKYKGEPTRLVIGDNNVFREHTTIHRSSKEAEATIIGSNNLFMAGSHAGHNSLVGSYVVVANGALLGGHATVADRDFISGSCLLHQFVRVGTLAIMQGGSAVSRDLPPFTIATGDNRICGLNTIGLRRNGFSVEDRLELKRLYRLLFLSGLSPRAAIAKAGDDFRSPASRTMIEFVASSRRGVCVHGRSSEPAAPEPD